jgi:hypothetical protein
MRQRITFIHNPENSIDPDLLKVDHNSINGPKILAVREDRVTLGLDELPSELRRVLSEAHELHIRWISPSTHTLISPLNSRISPGIHVFFTPQKNGKLDS